MAGFIFLHPSPCLSDCSVKFLPCFAASEDLYLHRRQMERSLAIQQKKGGGEEKISARRLTNQSYLVDEWSAEEEHWQV